MSNPTTFYTIKDSLGQDIDLSNIFQPLTGPPTIPATGYKTNVNGTFVDLNTIFKANTGSTIVLRFL